MSNKAYEIGIYNENVRAAMADGHRHATLDDEWSDVHYIEIKAPNLEDAKALVSRRYPAAQGFVISDAFEVPNVG